MIAVLPSWVSDTGAVVGIAAAFVVVVGAVAGVVILGVRKIVQPSIDKINETISDHMHHEERQFDRFVACLEIIASAVHVDLPSIRVSGGSDEGDAPELDAPRSSP